MHLAQQPGGFSSHCTYVQCIKPLNVMVGPHHRRQHLSSSRCWSVSNGTNSCSSSESSGPANGAASKDEAESKVKQLQLCNSIQKGYLSRQGQERQDKDSVCCWGGTDLPKHHTSRRGVANQVQLSAYPDCIGGGLADLSKFLRKHVDGAIGSVHLLPLYPSTGDRGFAPVTYQQVNPQFGTWNDVRDLSEEYELCLEYMVNHISPASPQFQDYVQNGEASHFSSMFVKWADIWPQGKPSAEELSRIRTRKPAPPVLKVHLADGSVVPLWNTFTDQQIDINPFSEEGWVLTQASLNSLCVNGGAKLIRLDAFGYVTKKAGTNCFMEEPEVWDLLERIRDVVKPYGVQLLCEVHEDFKLNIELARHGFWVYDFALPMLLLHALRFKTAESLKHWLSICPRRQITTLDTHDGMGVDDVVGLAPLVDVREVEQCILGVGGTVNYKHFYEPEAASDCSDGDDGDLATCNISSRKSLKAVEDCLKPDCMEGCYTSVQHQYNATYFAATREDPQMYLMARAVQFFTPGVPMVYYVGLLAGRNDYELLKQGSIRDINRHSFSLEEAEGEVRRPVVQALLKLCRFRNYHPAFKGRVFVDDSTPPHLLRVCWYHGTQHLAVLRADFQTHTFSISHTPYRIPKAEDQAAEEADLQSEFNLDMSQVFSVDALDLAARAQTRTKVTESVADLGVVDPEQLVCVHKKEIAQPANGARRSSRSNGNGSNSGKGSDGSHSQHTVKGSSSSGGARATSGASGSTDSNGSSSSSTSTSNVSQTSEPSTAAPSWVSVSSSRAYNGASDTEESDTDSSAGGSSAVASTGNNGSAQANLAGSSGVKSASSSGDDADKGAGTQPRGERASSAEAEWGLLQLDLSFAWQLEDKPVQDVGELLENASAAVRR